MIKFEGLNEYEYIIVGETWVVQFGYGTYVVNNTERQFKREQAVLPAESSVVLVKELDREVLYYKDSEGNEYSKEQKLSAENELNLYWDEDRWEYIFPNLDTEYEIKKRTQFLDEITPVYGEQKYEHKNIELKCVGVWEDTGSEYISTPYQVGHTKFSGDTVFCLHSGKLAKDVFTAVCPQAEVSGSSNLRFAKVNDKFIMYNLTNKYGWVENEAHKMYFTNLDDAKREEATIKEFIEAHVKCMLDSKRLNAQQRGNVYKEVFEIKRLTHELDVKAKASGDKRYVLKRLQELIDNIREED